jgi:hypothetical protein
VVIRASAKGWTDDWRGKEHDESKHCVHGAFPAGHLPYLAGGSTSDGALPPDHLPYLARGSASDGAFPADHSP